MIKKYGLKMLRGKLAIVRILRKIHINVRREVKDTTVKKEIVSLIWEVK